MTEAVLCTVLLAVGGICKAEFTKRNLQSGIYERVKEKTTYYKVAFFIESSLVQSSLVQSRLTQLEIIRDSSV